MASVSSTRRLEQRRDTERPEVPLITVLVPARDEEANIPRLREELGSVIDPMPYRFEVILVDNDSSDRTGELVKAICREDPRWKYVRLSRNFGAEASISAGYRCAVGDAVVVLYSDLQDPPELIGEFLAKWEAGFDVVYGVQTARAGEPALNTWLVRRAYRVIAAMSEVRIPPDASDFRLLTREVVDALDELPERSRYLRGMIAWLGFRQVGIPYERRPRTAGVSKSSRGFLIRFLLDAITSFSLRPLRFTALLAGLLSTLGVAWGAVLAARAIAGHSPSSASLLGLLIVALAALNAIGLWLISEYVGRIHQESRRRPLYMIAEAVNTEPPASRADAIRRRRVGMRR
jgi:dolichol-phosphate mannosyltransferase